MTDKLADYAREASKALSHMAGGGSEMFTRIGDEFYADPELCRSRYAEKMQRLTALRSDARLKALQAAIAQAADKLERQADCLCAYAEQNGEKAKPIPSVYHLQAVHFRDIAKELREQHNG